jgi:hypothetical protein
MGPPGGHPPESATRRFTPTARPTEAAPPPLLGGSRPQAAGTHPASALTTRPAPPPRRRAARRRAAWAAGIAAALAVAVLGATLAAPGLRHAIWDRDTAPEIPHAPKAGASDQAGDSGDAEATAVLFAKTLGGTGFDGFSAVAVTPDGGIAAAGLTDSDGGDFGPAKGGTDAVVARFGPDGELQWTKTLGGTDDDGFYAVAVTPDGGLAAAGNTYSDGGDFGPAKGESDAVVARFGPDGELQWAKTLGGTDYDVFGAVAVTPDGGIAAAGATNSDGGDFGPAKGDTDAVVARFGPDGELASG